ncbi:MAG: outer membrane beta-barrel protein, partial [Bacteroidota bacterium]
MKYPILIMLLLSSYFINSSHAQSAGLNGRLVEKNQSPLPRATVMLLNATDSTMEKFTISNNEGEFSFSKLKPGDFILQITYVGFQGLNKRIILSKGQVLSLGAITMEPENELLENVVIAADRIPIQFKKDTIEYNAGAFATKPGATVEDLLKKLPGIEVEQDGTIKAQGKTVNKVLVDGKEFFGDDPKIATKNLPADAMEKVQVFDKLSEMAEFTGVDDGQRNKTINLTLKDDKKNGVFGNVEAGYGQDERFRSKLNLNQFTKKQQLSLITSANNINEQNFSLNDYINLSGGISNLISGGGGQVSLELDEGLSSALGFSNGGIRNNWTLGANLNKDLSDKTALSVNYFFNDMRNNLRKSTERQNFGEQGIFNSNSDLLSISDYNLHRLNFKLKHQLDERQDLTFRSNVRYTLTRSQNDETTQTASMENNVTTSNDVSNQKDASGLEIGGELSYRKKFETKGRSITAKLMGSSTNNLADLRLMSQLTVDTQNTPFTSTINQFQNDENQKHEWGARLTYTEPVLNGKLLQGFVGIQTTNLLLNKDFFDISMEDEKLFNGDLSAEFDNRYQYGTGGLRLFLGSEKSRITFGLTAQQSSLKGNASNIDNILSRTFFNVLPNAQWQFDVSQASNLFVSYNTSVQAPTLEQLQPVVDNTNPQLIYNGNPNLNIEYAHRINLSYNLFDQFSLTSLFLNAGYAYVNNKITNQTEIDEFFRQVITPVNVNNDRTFTQRLSFSTPLRWMKSKINVNLNSSLNSGILFVNNAENQVNRTVHTANLKLENRQKKIVDAAVGMRVTKNIT